MEQRNIVIQNMYLGMQELAECVKELSDLLMRGGTIDDTLAKAKRNNISICLQRAAWRIERGTLADFLPVGQKPMINIDGKQ